MSYQRPFGTSSNSNNPFSSIMSLLIFIGVLVFLFFMVSSLVKLLYLVAPLLLIATLLINYHVVTDYISSVFNTFSTNMPLGIVKVLFSVFCYPFVIGWLFAKVMFYRKINTLKKDMAQQMNQTTNDTQYTDYEEISTDLDINQKPEKPIILELPKPKDKARDDFDQLFK